MSLRIFQTAQPAHNTVPVGGVGGVLLHVGDYPNNGHPGSLHLLCTYAQALPYGVRTWPVVLGEFVVDNPTS